MKRYQNRKIDDTGKLKTQNKISSLIKRSKEMEMKTKQIFTTFFFECLISNDIKTNSDDMKGRHLRSLSEYLEKAITLHFS